MKIFSNIFKKPPFKQKPFKQKPIKHPPDAELPPNPNKPVKQ
jgi:hypothetical protein